MIKIVLFVKPKRIQLIVIFCFPKADCLLYSLPKKRCCYQNNKSYAHRCNSTNVTLQSNVGMVVLGGKGFKFQAFAGNVEKTVVKCKNAKLLGNKSTLRAKPPKHAKTSDRG